MKIGSVVGELFCVGRWADLLMDLHEEANSRFS